jgi:hypothetical protein
MSSKRERLEQGAILGRSQIIPETIPPIQSDYSGWDKMGCDYYAKSSKLPDNHTVLEFYQQFFYFKLLIYKDDFEDKWSRELSKIAYKN